MKTSEQITYGELENGTQFVSKQGDVITVSKLRVTKGGRVNFTASGSDGEWSGGPVGANHPVQK